MSRVKHSAMVGALDVAFDASSGDAMMVWTQESPGGGGRATMSSRLRVPQTGWERPQQVINLALDWSHSRLRLAALPNGDFMLVAMENGPRPVGHGTGSGSYVAVYRYSKVGNLWRNGNQFPSVVEPLYFLPDAPAEGQVRELDVATNRNGQVRIAWSHEHPADPKSPQRRSIRLAHFDPLTGGWTVAQDSVDVPAADSAPDSSPGRLSIFPRIVVDDTGNALATWAQQDFVGSGEMSLWYRHFAVSGGNFAGAPRPIDGSA